MKRILEDYLPDDDIMSEEEFRVNAIKHIIYDKLSETDKRVILLYAELGSQREVGRKLGVSASTVNILIKRIREDILKYFKNQYDS
ncbi:sigma factor-like helix-turn-helix DNA-binding protein [Fibrobacter sp.]|uniref:sigma factor-like helix-turn-helix DNA-binding protein n=1 Tax=Fibrobacter sp. TaxID=35828 RepID=UPI00386E8FEA